MVASSCSPKPKKSPSKSRPLMRTMVRASLSLTLPAFALAALPDVRARHCFGARDIGEFESLPRFHLLAHRLEVPLHAVHPDCDAVNERERLRVLGKNRREHA